MNVESIAYRTDLLFPQYDGEILERRGYVAVLTPANPGFYWGNFLLFPVPPAPGDLERWTRLFEHEFGAHSLVRHQAFGWDSMKGELGAVDPFLRGGFNLVNDAVMTLDALVEPPRRADVTVRPLEGDADWNQMAALNVAGDPRERQKNTYTEFKHRLRERYRAMVEGGLGVWLGAFSGDRLVGQLGLFAGGDVARFQSVETHPDFRGRGICTTLVADACRLGLADLAPRLVLVAEDNSAAKRIYQRLGFEEVGRQVGVFKPA